MQGWEQQMAAGRFSAESVRQQVLLVPEAPVLIGLLLIGWAYGFPPAIGGLAALVVAFFIVRLFCLASAAQELGQARYRQADMLAQTALRLNPWSADALALRANTQLLQGNDEAAEMLLRDAIRRAPDNAANHAALAAILLARGAYTAGREHALQAYQIDMTSPFAAQQLAWLALHREDDPGKAQRIVKTIDLRAQPPTIVAPLLVLRGEAEIAQDHFKQARETVSILEAMMPTCPLPLQAELCYHLGRLGALLGEDGGTYFRQSVRLDPHGRWAHAAWRAAVNPTEYDYPRLAL
jgi:tetratricopeptide (TPR) repeat protein